jgi:hypothetical protein
MTSMLPASRSPVRRKSKSKSAGKRGSNKVNDGMDAKHQKYQQLLDFCKSLPPTPTASPTPCDESSLRGAVEAAARLDFTTGAAGTHRSVGEAARYRSGKHSDRRRALQRAAVKDS